jgi:GNAT superfamily N-acetyltransferase
MNKTAWRRTLPRVAEVLREEGVISLWFRILGEFMYRRLLLVERPLHTPLPVIACGIEVETGLLKKSEVNEYLSFRPAADPCDIQRRLEAGHRCFVARHGGRLVHTCWVATGSAWIEYLATEISLTPDEAYSYDSFAAPGFRGQNLSPSQLKQMLHYLRDNGYRRSVGVVMPENARGRRAAEKLGYRTFGVMGYVQFGPWRRQFSRVRPHARPPGSVIGRPERASQPHDHVTPAERR